MRKIISILAIFIIAIILVSCEAISPNTNHLQIFNNIEVKYLEDDTQEHLTGDIEFIYNELDGLTITFVSYNEAIEINGNKGLVTRGLEDQSVLIYIHIELLDVTQTFHMNFIVIGIDENLEDGFQIDVNNLEYTIGSDIPKYRDNFTATFNGNDITSDVQIDDSNVLFDQAGEYEIIYSFEFEGNIYNKTIIITVISYEDILPPIIIGNKDFTHFTGSDKPDYLNGVSATDNIDIEVDVDVDDSKVLLDTPGEYSIYYIAIDTSNNKTVVENTVTVKTPHTGNAPTITETFSNVTNNSSSYSSGNFTGVNGLIWSYEGTRTDQQLNDGVALTFGNKVNSFLKVNLESGISSFSIDARTVFSGSTIRKIALYINNVEISVFDVTGTIQTFTVSNLGYTESVILEIRNIGGERVTFDNIVLGIDTKSAEEKHLDLETDNLTIPLIFMDQTNLTFINESNNVDIIWGYQNLSNEYNNLVNFVNGLIQMPEGDIKVDVGVIATLTYQGFTTTKVFNLTIGEGEPITIAQVKNSANNSIVKTKGYVTSSVLNGNIYYAFIQDDNSGIYVQSTEKLTEGTEVIFKATKQLIGSVSTLVNLNSIEIIRTFEVNALKINLNQLGNYLGMKVNIEGYLTANTLANQTVYEIASNEGVIKIILPAYINQTLLQASFSDKLAGIKVNLEGIVYRNNEIYLLNNNNLLIDNNISETEVLNLILKGLDLPQANQEVFSDLDLPLTDNIFSSEITWMSTNINVLTDEGVVIKPENDTSVTLNYQIKLGSVVINEDSIQLIIIATEPLTPYYSRLEGLSGASFNNELINMIKTIGRQSGSPSQVQSIDKWGSSYYLIYDGQGSYGNREHTVPASYMRAVGKPEDDLHNLRAAKVSTNSTRSNYGFTDSTGGWDLINGRFWPGDEHKGDVARIVFYIVTRNGIPFESKVGGYGPIGNLDMFLRWHMEDPVNEFEIERNNRIFAIQSNRNPFIDYPEFATRLWGEPKRSYANHFVFDYTEDINLIKDLYYEEPKGILQ